MRFSDNYFFGLGRYNLGMDGEQKRERNVIQRKLFPLEEVLELLRNEKFNPEETSYLFELSSDCPFSVKSLKEWKIKMGRDKVIL